MKDRSAAESTHASATGNTSPGEDFIEQSVMENELQIDSNGLVSKSTDSGDKLEGCHRVDSWGVDSSTTLTEASG
jgi:hypothetical protein